MTLAGRTAAICLLACATAALLLCSADDALAQLNERCTVSILNRTVRVNPDGSWLLPNVPAATGQVKARATCVEPTGTRSGESDFFVILEGKVAIVEGFGENERVISVHGPGRRTCPPMTRFSSTVSEGKRRRPSGTRAMPLATRM